MTATVFGDNQSASHAVHEYIQRLRPSPDKYSLRPFNRFSTEFTYWWFVTTTEWPAFGLAKLTIHRWPVDGPADMCVGLYVERGFGKAAAEFSEVPANRILGPTWYWNKLLSRIGEGKIDSAIDSIGANTRSDVFVCVTAYSFNHVPVEDSPHPMSTPDGWIEFLVESESHDLTRTRQFGQPLHGLTGCRRIDDLVKKINTTPELDFFWTDVFIGLHLQYGDDQGDGWRASDIWELALAPWAKLVL